MRRWSSLLLVVVSACTPGSEPTLDSDHNSWSLPVPIAVDFSAAARFESPTSNSPIRVTAGSGTIDVTGGLGPSSPCYGLTATATAWRQTITLKVVATRHGDICIQALAAFDYDAVLRDVAPGSYRLIVEHVGGLQSTRVADLPVVVH